MTVACGAAIQLACIGGRALGYRPRVSLLPEGAGSTLMARLVEDGRWDTTEDDCALLAAVSSRRTDRGPLDGDRLPPEVPFLLQSVAAAEGASLRLVSTPADRSTLAGLVERADRILVQGGAVDRELAHWVREPGDARGDGVPADHTRRPAASYRAPFVQRDFSSAQSRPAQDRPGPDRPIVGVLCTAADHEPDWLTAGRALVAVLLRAAVWGANASYLNQPVEVRSLRSELRDQLDLPGVAQLVRRIGIGGEVAPPPRRDALNFGAPG